MFFVFSFYETGLGADEKHYHTFTGFSSVSENLLLIKMNFTMLSALAQTHAKQFLKVMKNYRRFCLDWGKADGSPYWSLWEIGKSESFKSLERWVGRTFKQVCAKKEKD